MATPQPGPGLTGSLADRWRPRCLCSWSERSRVLSTLDVCTCRWAGSGSGGEGEASRQDPRAGGAAQDHGQGPCSRPPGPLSPQAPGRSEHVWGLGL